jgi:hypothetical protein
MAVVLVGAFAEIASAIGLYFSLETGQTFQDVFDRQERLALTSRGEEDSGVVVHPFTGWCLNPQVSEGDEVFGKRLPVNRFGFVDDQESIQKRAPDRLIIGITGGSVAWQMTVGGDEIIREILRQSPEFRDLDIRILRIGQSGYKQPQQLMTVNWLMALGGEFDAIVNLDGYNELALTLTENFKRGIHSAYPRAWNTRMLELIDPRESAERMRLLEITSHRQRMARRIKSVPWRWSYTANAAWLPLDWLARREKQKLEKLLLEKRSNRDGRGFAESGPIEEISSDEEALEIAADTWKRCSIQTHRLLSSSSTVYLHALQPNQHLEGSKPLSDEEVERAIQHPAATRAAIQTGYPLLLKRQPSLEAAGIQFLDLSQLYHDEAGTMYSDPCCHLNEEGNQRLTKAIALRLRELLEKARSM